MKIILPELGEGISSVEIRDVLVKEGDSISKNQPILILETDKASMEIPAEVEGVVLKVHVKVGDKISPNDTIITLDNVDDSKDLKSEDNIDNKNLIKNHALEEKTLDGNQSHEILEDNPLVEESANISRKS